MARLTAEMESTRSVVASVEWLVAPAGSRRDFDLDLYDLTTQTSVIERHVRTFLGEKLNKPRVEELWIGRDGSLDPEYREILQRGIEYARMRGDEEAVSRYEAELTGAENMVRLILGEREVGNLAPIVVQASDPGEVYVGDTGIRRSVTFVATLGRTEEEGSYYRIFSLPTKHIGLEKHWVILSGVADLRRTAELLGHRLVQLDAETLVAYPVLLDQFVTTIDQLSLLLGFVSWDAIEEGAADQLKLDGDDTAALRREEMVKFFTEKIVSTVAVGSSEQKIAVVNAMSDMFALEAGGEFVGLGADEIRILAKKTIDVAMVQELRLDDDVTRYDPGNYPFGDLGELSRYQSWMRQAFATNSVAWEARATGCGGSGIDVGLDNDYAFSHAGIVLDYQMTDFQNLVTQPDVIKTEEKRDYRFDHSGECVVCHREPVMLGPCDICEKCDDHIRDNQRV